MCSNRDGGHDKYDYTSSGLSSKIPPPTVDDDYSDYVAIIDDYYSANESPDSEDCSEIKGRRVCCSNHGACSGYTGPDPTPWIRAKFTSCEYSDGYLNCKFTSDCSQISYRMVCCDDDGKCSGYNGQNPGDHLCTM